MVQFGGACPSLSTYAASILFCGLLVALGLSGIRVPLRGSGGGEPVRRDLTKKILTGEEGYRRGITLSDAYGYIAATIGGGGAVYLTAKAAWLCLV